jgi:predicted  nucleic acid-binding Zn-ribbon protein
MDSTILWMLILAGATVALLGAFLVVSEKELRKKRRELASLAAKLSQTKTSIGGADYQDNLSKLEKSNQELQEQLSAVSSRLESTEREFAELESERWRLNNFEAEKRQLEASNQKLNDEVSTLRQQVNSALKANDDSHFEKAALDEQLARIASELNSTTEKLEQAKARIEELEDASNPLALSNAERSLTESRREFENNLRSLKRELADSEEKLQAFDTVNRQLLDLEQKYDKALHDNRQLQQEISRWQNRLTHSEEAQPRFAMIRQQRDDSRLKSDMSDHQAQMQFENIGEVDEMHGSGRQTVQSGIVLRSAATPGPSLMDGLESYGETTGLHPSIEYLEPSLHENETTSIDNDLRQSVNSRTAQLSHLLAWVRLHGSDTYQEQIDSLKDFTDLSERERQVVRDIFLARADEAQKRGRDDQMLRYRSWAKNIVYHTRFADDGMEDLTENGTTENIPAHAASSGRTAIDTTSGTADTNANKTDTTAVQPDRIKSPAGNVALGIGIGLGLVLILLVQLFFDTSAEITVASDDTSTAANSRTAELPKRQNSIDADQSPTVSKNAGDVEPRRNEERLRAKPDDVKAAVRKTPKEPAVKTTRSQSIWGAYTIVKSTPVYSDPSEESALITSLDAGTQVNVVAAHRGWYEIRSKSGRPPGFIRQEGASRNR